MKNTLIILAAFLSIFYQSYTKECSEEEMEYQLPLLFQSSKKIYFNAQGGGDIEYIPMNNSDYVSITV